MSGFIRKIAGKPKVDKYRATEAEKFNTNMANTILNIVNPQIREVLNTIKDDIGKNFTGESEGIGNFEAAKVAKKIPGPVGTMLEVGVGMGNMFGRTANVNDSADRMIGVVANRSTSGTKGFLKNIGAQSSYLKGSLGEFDTAAKSSTAGVKLATTDLLSDAKATISSNTAPFALINPTLQATGFKIGKETDLLV